MSRNPLGASVQGVVSAVSRHLIARITTAAECCDDAIEKQGDVSLLLKRHRVLRKKQERESLSDITVYVDPL